MNWNNTVSPPSGNQATGYYTPTTTNAPAGASFEAAAPPPTTPDLFGVVVPGCPVSTSLTQVDSGKWTIALGEAPESFVVFLTLAEPLPEGYGISLFLAREDELSFQYVGYLSQGRPSGLFRVPATLLNMDQPVRVVLGLSLELAQEIINLGQTQQQPLEVMQAATRVAIAERLLEDLYGFTSSFARGISSQQAPDLGLEDGEYVVMPANYVDKWRQRIETKIRKDVTFWQ